MNQFLRAESGEGIFWTIMIIIWIVSKATAASRKAKPKSTAAAAPAARPKLPPRELQAFLDSLAGGSKTPARPSVHIPIARRMGKPLQPTPEKAPVVRREPGISSPDIVSEFQISRQMSLLNTSVRDLITDIPSVRIPNLSMGFFSPQKSAAAADKPNLRNRSQLRKAMLGHVILSRPASTGW